MWVSLSLLNIKIYIYIYIYLVVLNSVTPWTIVSYGSSVHGILQAILLERVAIPFSRGSFWPRDKTLVSCIAGRFFTVWATREAPCICMCECEHECVCVFKITSLSIHLSVDICAAMNTGTHVSFWIINLPRYMPRSRTARSYNDSIFDFLRTVHTLLHSGCTNSQSHRQRRGIPCSPHHRKHLLFVDFLMMAVLTGMRCASL